VDPGVLTGATRPIWVARVSDADLGGHSLEFETLTTQMRAEP
jgi:hypothetical protein